MAAWTRTALLEHADLPGGRLEVLEDLTDPTGGVRLVGGDGTTRELGRTAEPVRPAGGDHASYLGHELADVLDSDVDLLGRELLARAGDGDPSYDEVAAALPPIRTMDVHTFVGRPETPDKTPFTVDGVTPAFDAVALDPGIGPSRSAGLTRHGLLGGDLPVVRTLHPDPDDAGSWWEVLAFAPARLDNGNPRIQPVWYRVARVEHGRQAWVRHLDSALPAAPRADFPDGVGFWVDLLALGERHRAELAAAPRLDLPEPGLADVARHCLVRAHDVRSAGFPKYGVVDRLYGGAEHDGFPDTVNSEAAAATAWGLHDRAHEVLDTYLTHFVRDDGSLVYRGPETGQLGRLLTVTAEHARHADSGSLLSRHRARLDAVATTLTDLYDEACALPDDDPAHGVLHGWCEADSCLEEDPARYVLPYLSNSAEAARGLRELGSAWAALGVLDGDEPLAARGRKLVATGEAIARDLHRAIERTTLHDTEPTCLPVIAGFTTPYDVAARADEHDPQCRAYRANSELLMSGELTTAEAAQVVDYREAHRDVLLGIPSVYGWSSGQLGGFLAHGHAFGLLQHDRVPDFLLLLQSFRAHQLTRGTWTAPETRPLDPDRTAAPMCVPAQLVVPLLVRWLLAVEDPATTELWLLKAAPRAWFADGERVVARDLATSWGPCGVEVTSHLADGRLDVVVDLPDRLPDAGHGLVRVAPSAIHLRLRLPGGHRIGAASADGLAVPVDAEREVVELPVRAGTVHVVIRTERP